MENITVEDLINIGIHKMDPRFKNIFETNSINSEDSNNFLTKYDNGQLEVNNWSEITKIIKDIYNQVKNDNKGNVADYIPQLASVDSELFGIVAVTVDGQVFEIGDVKNKFCVQSCSKPITYGIGIENYGENYVHNFIGKEPSGRNFNELCLDIDNLPHNPLINSGAIMSASLIEPESYQADRFDFALNYWKRLTAGNYISFNNSVYLSEKDTADRNYCLAYMMQEKESFKKGKSQEIAKKRKRSWNLGDLVKNLEIYFQFCSLETDLLGAGLLAATLANGGVNPWTQDKIFKYSTVKKVLTLMLTCGMYDYSGEWNYRIGIPGKSGVSGLIYGVVPGVMGIAVYSPKLDKIGNSYRGVEFFKLFSQKLNIHVFDNEYDSDKTSISRKEVTNNNLLGYLLLDASSKNDLETIKEVLSKGCNVNFQDYDKRTALHLAVSESNIDIIKFLIRRDADPNLKDRWGKTPIDETNHETIIKILNKVDLSSDEE